MAELQPIIVFHGRDFVSHLGICNPICVKLLQIMSGVIPSNIKKRRIYLKPFSWGPQTRHTHTPTDTHTHTHTNTYTHTHDDSIKRNSMRWISPKNAVLMPSAIPTISGAIWRLENKLTCQRQKINLHLRL